MRISGLSSGVCSSYLSSLPSPDIFATPTARSSVALAQHRALNDAIAPADDVTLIQVAQLLLGGGLQELCATRGGSLLKHAALVRIVQPFYLNLMIPLVLP